MKRFRKLRQQMPAAACSALASSVATAALLESSAFATGLLFMGLGTLVMVCTCFLADSY